MSAAAQDGPKQAESPKVTQTEWLVDAQDATTREHGMGIRAALKRYPKAALWSLAMSSTIIMEGYDTMLVGNFFAQPAFQRHYGEPTAKGTYEVTAPWQAGLNNGSACGQLIGLLLAGIVSERIGFRMTMLGGLCITAAFIFLQFFAPNIEVLLAAQILFGRSLAMLGAQSKDLMCLTNEYQVSLLAYSRPCQLSTPPRLHRSLSGRI